MAFKILEKRAVCPDDPESLFRDLRKKTVPGLLSHQADIMRSYLAVHTQHSDIALQLPRRVVGILRRRDALSTSAVSAEMIKIRPDVRRGSQSR